MGLASIAAAQTPEQAPAAQTPEQAPAAQTPEQAPTAQTPEQAPAAQTPEAGHAPVASDSATIASSRGEQIPLPARVPSERPAFLLPDVVVEGEDRSRLGGGIRVLEMEVPTVRPQQEPLPVDPGPSAYEHRRGMPFRIVLPARTSVPDWRGAFRVAPSSAPGLSATGVLLPGSADRSLLLGWLDWHRDRLESNERLAGSLGYELRDSAADPRTRLSLGADGQREEWTLHAGGKDVGEAADETRFFRGRLERRVGGASAWSSVLGVEPFYQRASLQRPVPRATDGARDENYRAEWGGIAGTIDHVGRWDARPALRDNAARVFGERIGRDALLPEYHVRGEWLHATREWDDPVLTTAVDSSDSRLRWDARAGASLAWAGGRLVLGAAGAGFGEELFVGPWVGWARESAEATLAYRVEFRPVATFADQYLSLGEWQSHGEMPEREAFGLMGHRGLTRDGAPHAAWRSRICRQPAGAIVDPHLPMQRAWPRLTGKVILTRDTFHLSGGLAVARLEDPLTWQAVSDTTAEGLYQLTTAENRYVARVECESRYDPHPNLGLTWAYAASWDEGSGADRLAFLPRNDLFVGVGRDRPGYLWGVGVQLRDDAPGLNKGFASVSASVGYRFREGRVYVRGVNLTGEDVIYLPGRGRDDIEVQLVWEQALVRTSP